jgi:predicted GIY-YIG superfamily endonuclease
MAKRTSRRRTTQRGRTARSGRGTKRTARAGGTRRYWSHQVMERSDALDLERGVFKLAPREMARSLKRSADRSGRRKSSPFRSAMSMLTFFENRAGRNLSASRRDAIRKAKAELRRLYGREPAGR